MRSAVHFLPILTTLLAVPFTVILYRHWRHKPGAYYLMWWMIGAAMYGVGTFTESLTTLFGWQPAVFKAWYISGALLGGAPLAQGSVYLFFQNRTAHRLTAVLVTFIAIAAVCVLLSPVNLELVEPYRLSGSVLEWQWVRAFSPFVNTYAFIFLVGGAFWSAWRYWRRDRMSGSRVWGNVLIAVGALLPGIGGSSARMGYVEVLYVTELVGLLLIGAGYAVMTRTKGRSVHQNQQARAA